MVRYLLLVVLAGLIGGVPSAAAGPAAAKTPLVKAAFLYNFAKFTEWPPEAFADSRSPFVLCLFGSNPFGRALKSLQGKTIKGRQVVIKSGIGADDAELEACHILFIDAAEQRQSRQLIALLKERPVLTIGDRDPFIQLGGMITFLMLKGKVSFAINVEAAQRVDLQISSRLLKIAVIVKAE